MQVKGIMSRLGVSALAVATVVAGAAYVSSSAHAQAPSTVPAARFYGTARTPAGQPVTNLTITGAIGSIACTATQAIGSSQGSAGTDNSGNYSIDIQSVPGCTTPGATIVFTAGGLRARETGTVPDIPGTAVRLNLTFATVAQATPTAPPPPPPPSRAPTAPPTVVATPRPATATPPPAATPRPAASPVSQQAPRGPVKGPVAAQGPKVGVPVAQAPRAAAPSYAAPAAAPRLPSTGTGGLLDQQATTGMTLWALAAIVLAGLGISATGLMAYRRDR